VASLLLLLLLPASAARASKSGSCEVRDASKLPSSKYCSQACKCGVRSSEYEVG
jgi:hypothetical protein